MSSLTIIAIISLVIITQSVQGDEPVSQDKPTENDNYDENDTDDFYDDDDEDDDGGGEETNQDALKQNLSADDLAQTDLYKFLDNIDEDALDEGKESYVGKATKDTYCYVNDDEPYQYFSTKTRYPEYNDTSSLDPPQGYEIKYVWLMMRHGIRYGSWLKTYDYYKLGNFRDQIIKHAGENRTELCLDDLLNLLLWIPKESENGIIRPETLTQSGYKLVQNFGKLLKEKFSHLIPMKYDEEQIKIQFSDEIKVNQSVEAITQELFGTPFVPKLDDNLFDKVYVPHCKKPDARDRETGLNYTYLAETSPYTNEMVHKISQRLGYEEDLTYRDIAKLYNGCQYEIAWGYERSPWCAPFKKEDLQIMEYIGDISYFYYCGPGNVYNIFQGCVLLKDLITKLITAAEEKSIEKMSLYLGHSTTVLFLITQLGLVYDGNHLTHDNYQLLSDRKWRTSIIAPYGGNVMAILHKRSTDNKHFVKFLLNQKPFIFQEICDEETQLCSLEEIYKLFEPIVTSDECSLKYCNHTPEEMCFHLRYDGHDCEILKLHYREMKEREKQKKMENQSEQIDEYDYLETLFKCSCVFLIVSIVILLLMCCKLDKRLARLFRRVTTTKDTKTTDEVIKKLNGKKENRTESISKTAKDKKETNSKPIKSKEKQAKEKKTN